MSLFIGLVLIPLGCFALLPVSVAILVWLLSRHG
jgi:hypothetical protein